MRFQKNANMLLTNNSICFTFRSRIFLQHVVKIQFYFTKGGRFQNENRMQTEASASNKKLYYRLTDSNVKILYYSIE